MVESPVQDAETPVVGISPAGYRLPAATRLGKVRLAVSELERSLSFYKQVIGLQEVGRCGHLAQLAAQGSDRVLLELEQLPGVEAIGRRSRLGLYHTAFLLPTREDLSSFVQHLQRSGVPFGAGDHLYSEALYLTDPDGLSVEVYADRPRDRWTIENREIVAATDALRFETLPVVPIGSWPGVPMGTTMGHVHFYVGNLDEARQFYYSGLGLDITTWRYPGALFTSAGGYHHHVGLNVWAAASPPAAKTDARLLFCELVLPTRAEVKTAAANLAGGGHAVTTLETGVVSVTDPWGITCDLPPQTPANARFAGSFCAQLRD